MGSTGSGKASGQAVTDYGAIATDNGLSAAVHQFEKDTGIKVKFDWTNPKEMSQDNVIGVMNVLAELKQRYGQYMGDIRYITTYKKNDGTGAYTRYNDGIHINSAEFAHSGARLNRDYTQWSGGYHNGIVRGRSAMDLVSHEVGHHIFFKYLENTSKQVGGTSADFMNAYRWAFNGMNGNRHDPNSNRLVLDKVANDFRQIYARIATSGSPVGRTFNRTPSTRTLLSSAKPSATRSIDRSYPLSEYAGYSYHELAAEAFVDHLANGANASQLTREVMKLLGVK